MTTDYDPRALVGKRVTFPALEYEGQCVEGKIVNYDPEWDEYAVLDRGDILYYSAQEIRDLGMVEGVDESGR